MIAFGGVLPGVLLIVMAYQGWQILKHTVRGYKVAKRLGQATNETEQRQMEEAEQKVAAQQQEDKSGFQLVKILEVTGESMPQAILQTSIVLKKAIGGLDGLWEFLATEFNSDPLSSTIVVVLSSLLSLVLTGGSMMTESLFTINGLNITTYHSLAFTMVNIIMMIPVILPRLFGYSLIMASMEGWIPTIPIMVGGIIYAAVSTLIIRKFKQQRKNPEEFKDISQELRKMVITAMFMPCLVINPQWDLLNYLSATSGAILCLILSVLILISHKDPSLLSSNMMEDQALFETVCANVICMIVFGCIITAAQVWLVRWRHQTFLFQCIFGNKKAVEKMLLSRDTKHHFTEVNCFQLTSLDLAIAMGHSEVVKLIKKHGQLCRIPAPKCDSDFYSKKDSNPLDLSYYTTLIRPLHFIKAKQMMR